MVHYFVQFDTNLMYHKLAQAFLSGSQECGLALVTRQGTWTGEYGKKRDLSNTSVLDVDYC